MAGILLQVVEKQQAESLEAEVAALRSSHTALGSTVKALANSKADREGVDSRLEGFRAAVEDMKTSVLSHIAERAAARSADVKAALEAVAALERRASALEGAVAEGRTATMRAGGVAGDAHEAVEELRPAIEALQRVVWGARGGPGSGEEKALVDVVAEVQVALRQACSGDALAAVKDLAIQVRPGLVHGCCVVQDRNFRAAAGCDIWVQVICVGRA